MCVDGVRVIAEFATRPPAGAAAVAGGMACRYRAGRCGRREGEAECAR